MNVIVSSSSEFSPSLLVFFLKKGKVAFVLKEYKNFEFIKINEGYFFGEVDLLFYGEIRQYTARAIKDCEFYVLNKKDFKKIFLVDFRDIGAEMYDNGHERKVRTRRIYKEAVQACKQHENPNKDDFNIKGVRSFIVSSHSIPLIRKIKFDY